MVNFCGYSSSGSCVVCAPLDRYVGRHLDRYVGRHLDRYIGRHIGRCSTDMSVEMSSSCGKKDLFMRLQFSWQQYSRIDCIIGRDANLRRSKIWILNRPLYPQIDLELPMFTLTLQREKRKKISEVFRGLP